MSEHKVTRAKIDRRTFIKVLGSAGATAAIVSACGPQSLGQAPAAPQAPLPPPAAPPAAQPPAQVTGKVITLAAVGPGGNPNYEPADDLKFVPPEKIPAGKAADLFASLDKSKLLTTYQRMVPAANGRPHSKTCSSQARMVSTARSTCTSVRRLSRTA
jgi:hypothetical protein